MSAERGIITSAERGAGWDVASARLSWDQWLDYLECRAGADGRLLDLPQGFDISHPADLQWLEQVCARYERPGPSLPL